MHVSLADNDGIYGDKCLTQYTGFIDVTDFNEVNFWYLNLSLTLSDINTLICTKIVSRSHKDMKKPLGIFFTKFIISQNYDYHTSQQKWIYVRHSHF